MVFSRGSKGSSTDGNKRRLSTALAAINALNCFIHCHLFLYAIVLCQRCPRVSFQLSLSLSPISYILISVVVSLFLFLLNGRCRKFSAAAPFAAVSYRRNTQQPNGKVGKKKKKKKKMLLLLLIPPLLTGIPGKGN